MPQKRHTVDQIVAKLRKANVRLGKRKNVPESCQKPQNRLLTAGGLIWLHGA